MNSYLDYLRSLITSPNAQTATTTDQSGNAPAANATNAVAPTGQPDQSQNAGSMLQNMMHGDNLGQSFSDSLKGKADQAQSKLQMLKHFMG